MGSWMGAGGFGGSVYMLITLPIGCLINWCERALNTLSLTLFSHCCLSPRFLFSYQAEEHQFVEAPENDNKDGNLRCVLFDDSFLTCNPWCEHPTHSLRLVIISYF